MEAETVVSRRDVKRGRRGCVQCKRAHLSCESQRPCRRCIKRGLSDQCMASSVAEATRDSRAHKVIASTRTFDHTGQICPVGRSPFVTASLWEDENTLAFHVEWQGVAVSRREDNHMINGTRLLNVAGRSRGTRDNILAAENIRHVIETGPTCLLGVWIPFERALELANQHKITEDLYPLFVHTVGDFLSHPANRTPTSSNPNAPPYLQYSYYPPMPQDIRLPSLQGDQLSPLSCSMKSVNASSGSQENDYQMQLMLLEQQNKKRLLMHRQEQEQKHGNDALQEYETMLKHLEQQNKMRILVARQKHAAEEVVIKQEPEAGEKTVILETRLRAPDLQDQQIVNTAEEEWKEQDQEQKHNNDALQEYETMLKHLEQQNKMRILVARQKHAAEEVVIKREPEAGEKTVILETRLRAPDLQDQQVVNTDEEGWKEQEQPPNALQLYQMELNACHQQNAMRLRAAIHQQSPGNDDQRSDNYTWKPVNVDSRPLQGMQTQDNSSMVLTDQEDTSWKAVVVANQSLQGMQMQDCSWKAQAEYMPGWKAVNVAHPPLQGPQMPHYNSPPPTSQNTPTHFPPGQLLHGFETQLQPVHEDLHRSRHRSSPGDAASKYSSESTENSATADSEEMDWEEISHGDTESPTSSPRMTPPESPLSEDVNLDRMLHRLLEGNYPGAEV